MLAHISQAVGDQWRQRAKSEAIVLSQRVVPYADGHFVFKAVIENQVWLAIVGASKTLDNFAR